MVGPVPMVRLSVGGKTRRISMLRAAWMIAHGAAPRGVVRPKDGDPWNGKAENLDLVRHCSHRPGLKGSPATSLTCRQSADRALLEAMAGHSGAAVAELGRIVGASEARTSARLGKLAKRDLVTSPMCIPGRSWMLTAQGRAAAIGMSPMLDATDRAILAALHSSSMGPSRLARRCAVSEPTVTRRARTLAARALVIIDPRKFYQITTAGIEALGDAQPPARWLDPVRISAAASREVQARGGANNVGDDRPARLRAAHLPLKIMEGGKAKLGRPPSTWSEAKLTSERAKAG